MGNQLNQVVSRLLVTDLSGYQFETLQEDGEFVLYRGRQSGVATSILMLVRAVERRGPASHSRLEHEYSLAALLDPAWAATPLNLTRHEGRLGLVLADPGADPMHGLLGQSLELTRFLRIAASLTGALREVHGNGLIHKDIKAANLLVNAAGSVWITGFGIASRQSHERQVPVSPEVIVGTLAYMSPEQTGRMNRSIDARSDLYSLGVTLYELLTGVLPFAASDPMEWIHCHIARKPTPPDERVSGLPTPVNNIVLKLLAKNVEDRYQTAAGAEADLRRCLTEWEAHGRIDPFQLGAHDGSDRLLVPEKLYGREAETDVLLAAFDRVVTQGNVELVLVSGYSGIGKSSIVNELHKVLVAPRGLFAAGKFDQYRRGIPYATLAQAFQGLIRELLTKSDAELGRWRQNLAEALGPNGQLMVNLIPELALIIGEQPPVLELPPQNAQNRFQLVFRRFLGVFARPEHPLALFLDDLQWLDAATLELLERISTDPEVRHLMLVGAYRDNEVSALHPLLRTLESIRKLGGKVQEIVLAPLIPTDVTQLVADALHTEFERAQPLADLVFEKTDGNPFFVIQFVTALAEEGLLTFDPAAAAWTWDLVRIKQKGFADNVADLMARKVNRLPAAALEVLKQLACLGNSAQVSALGMVLGISAGEIHAALLEAVRVGLIVRRDDRYAFLHDRVQEASYVLIPEAERAAVHLQIGRMLSLQVALGEFDGKIFEIVTHLDRGADLIHSPEERERVAALNLAAGRRAKNSAAHASALTYFTAGRKLLTADSWERHYRLTFDLEFHSAECEFLTGDLAVGENRLSALSERVTNLLDGAAVARLRVALYTTLDRSDRAIEVGLEHMRHIGLEWSRHPTDEDVRTQYDRLRQSLAQQSFDAILDLPLMSNQDWRATMDVLADLMPPLLFTEGNLHDLALLSMVNISIEHGHCDASCYAYARLHQVLGYRFGDYQTAFRFGQLGCDLVDMRGLDRFKARVYMAFGIFVIAWSRHLPTARTMLIRALDAANAVGDLTFAVYVPKHLSTNLLISGEPLSHVQQEAEQGLAFARKAKFALVADAFIGELMLIRSLRGLPPDTVFPDEEERGEGWFERHLEQSSQQSLPACRYWIYQLQLRFFAGDFAGALVAAGKASSLLWSSRAMFEIAEYHLFAALAQAAACDSAPVDMRRQHLEALYAHHKLISAWAENCPENFANRKALVGAEIARLEGRELEAERLFEAAIQSAREFAFIQNEALANELAAKFYVARGFEEIARLYLRNARDCYFRWGAEGKVRQLEQLHPHLRPAEALHSQSGASAPIKNLDIATVVRVSQAVSGEIDLEKLIDTIMVVALEHAGADRGLLILPRDEEYRIEAVATTDRASVTVSVRQASITSAELPESVLRYVIRTHDTVILDDAAAPNQFSGDVYIRRKDVRSVLCLPLLKQAVLIGVLYLENDQVARVFTPARLAVLRLLATQAAISLENARLYADSKQREHEMQGLVSALHRSEAYLGEAQKLSHTGSFGWNVSRGEINWSNETFRIFGYAPQASVTIEMVFNRVHPDDRALVERAIDRAATHKEPFDVEHRLQMPDGSIRHLHVVAHALVDEPQNLQFAGAIMDITDRKQGEEALRRSEQRYRNLFDHMPVALWQLNARGVLELFKQLRAEGVKDLGAHFDAHPDLLQRCMEMLIIEEVNEHTVQMLGGRDKSEFVGTSIARYFPKESPTFRRSMVSRYRGDPNYAAETTLFTLDGRSVEVLYTASRVGPLTEEGMSLLGVIDITERKRAEKALLRSERRYQNMFQAMAVAFFAFDFSGAKDLMRGLRASGITDFRRHFKENPETVRQFMRATRIIEVNDHTVASVGGGSREGLMGSVELLWPEESTQAYAEVILSALGRKQSFSVETPFSRVDRSVYHGHFTVWYSADEPTRGLAGVIDITERKQAYLALERSEQRYRHLFNYMPIALEQLDARKLVELFKELRAQGVTDLGPYFDAHPDFLRRCMEALVVEEVNARTVQLLGVRDASELVGKTVGPNWKKRPDTFRRAMESRFRGTTAFEEETQWVTRDGRTVDVHFTSSRLQVGDTGISLIGATDISQRVQAFSALEKSEQRYRLLFHNVPFPLWQIDAQPLVAMLTDLRAQGVKDLSAHIDAHPDFLANVISAQKFEEINDHAVHLFGARDRNELLGTSPWAWLKSVDILRRAVESRWRGEDFYQETTKLETRKGRVIDALFFTARPQKIEGPPITIVGVIDLTAQIRAQEELQRLRTDFAHAARISTLGELTASIAHEVNQPLAAIAAGGEASLRWLARATPDLEEVRALTKNVVADARRASDIINRIRTMATRRAPEQTLLSLDEVIREALLFLRHEVEARGISVSHLPSFGQQKVLADRTQLQQVIVNLAVNAVQAIVLAGSTDRNVIIRTVEHPAALRCSVEDSGPGIEPKHVTRLFHSFFTTKDSGMGMGLRICRSIIEAHGGRIEVDNRSTLGGARFSFTLPVAGKFT